jgi:hypothetical protein
MSLIDKAVERLSIRNAWIGQRRERIRSLRSLLIEAEQSDGIEGINFINTLMDRLVFLTSDEFDRCIYEMAEYIDSSFDLSKTVICAATADHEKDSGQKVLYDLSSALGLLGHTKIHTVNRYDHVYKKAKIVPTDIVLIDEFIGTGRSFMGRVRTIRGQYSNGNKAVPKIHGVAIAGMSEGLRGIAHGFDSLGVCTSLVKGIQALAPRQLLQQEYALMSRLEDRLLHIIDDKELPRLGDGGCEALFSRNLGNCPNSVFPIFWWSKDSNGQSRSTFFPRVL